MQPTHLQALTDAVRSLDRLSMRLVVTRRDGFVVEGTLSRIQGINTLADIYGHGSGLSPTSELIIDSGDETWAIDVPDVLSIKPN